MSLLAPWFAIAGLVAAAGPVLIHLLNRQRYRVVDWAAMDFLREAVFRNRRIMQLRDLLLLALRTACIILFGLAMARPYFSGTAGAVDPNQPVHAVVLLDNSLSMAYQKLDGDVLKDAKLKARELIEQLPRGSRISVLPTCGSAAGFSYTAYYTPEDALEAVEAIEVVDRAARGHETLDLALEACRRMPTMRAKRVVLITDQQFERWPVESLTDQLRQLGDQGVAGGVEVVDVIAPEVENAWISDFKLRDGVADLETPAVFVATVSYQGSFPRPNVELTLMIDGVTIAVQTVGLQPGQSREIEFPPYQFDVPVEAGKPTFAAAEVFINKGDNLPADDRRFAVVPVVATLPVVFVDQYGQGDEDPSRNLYGETFHLRRLLAPVTSEAIQDKQLIKIRHLRIDQLDRGALEDARLVVIAGVGNPQGTVQLLREYVQQGGNLVIAAGGEFNPADWTQEAWNNGLGILPAPLSPLVKGRLPEEARGDLETVQLDFDSLKDHDYFALEAASREELEDLYRLPYFFKMVEADVGPEVKQKMVATVAEQIEQHRRTLGEIHKKLAELDKRHPGDTSAEDRQQREQLQRQRAELEPDWLLWAAAAQAENGRRPVQDLAQQSKFSVLARYTNGLPYMVERRCGAGRVLLVTTGVFSSWNTVSLTNTVLVFDRILRGMLQDTLPGYNMDSQEQSVLPVTAAQRSAVFSLLGPEGSPQPLVVEAVGADRYGVTVKGLTRRGVYRVTATRTKSSAEEGLEAKLWEVPLAINGPADESDLVAREESELRQRAGRSGSLETAQTAPGLQRAGLQGTYFWKLLMVVVLVLLLLELLILAWPSLGGERTAS